jgi:hypothetical protein
MESGYLFLIYFWWANEEQFLVSNFTWRDICVVLHHNLLQLLKSL